MWSAIFQAGCGHYSFEYAASLITYPRSAQDWDRQHPVLYKGRTPEVPHLYFKVYTLREFQAARVLWKYPVSNPKQNKNLQLS